MAEKNQAGGTESLFGVHDSDLEHPMSGSDVENEVSDAASDDENDFDSEEEELQIQETRKKLGIVDNFAKTEDKDDNDDDDDDDDDSDQELVLVPDGIQNHKLKKLTAKQLEKETKKIKKTGVCYLSRIPPYMKPSTLRTILSKFGKVDRLFLKPEDAATYNKRVKYGGNKKKNYTEGWVEFVKKREAKICASTMNGNKIGGRKTSYYYDDIMNIKYLPKFKWHDLTQQIAKENEVRLAKLALELSQQQKMNKSFINNVEKSKMIKNIQKKRNTQDEDDEMRRFYKQRKVTSTRAEAKDDLKVKSKPDDKLTNVLSKVF